MNKEKESLLKKALKILLPSLFAIAVMLASFGCFSMVTNASESYTHTWKQHYGNWGEGTWSITTPYPAVLVQTGSVDSYTSTGTRGDYTYPASFSYELYIYEQTGKYINTYYNVACTSGISVTTRDIRAGSSGHSFNMTSIESTNIPVFATVEDAKAYLINGDDSGQLNKPVPDWENSLENGTFGLDDFGASLENGVLSCIWDGVSFRVVDISDYKNTFVNVNIAIAPRRTLKTEIVNLGFIELNKNTFVQDITDLIPEGYYVHYVECVPYYYESDDMTKTLYRGIESYRYWVDPAWDNASVNNTISLNSFFADNGVNCTWNGITCPIKSEQDKINAYVNSYVCIEVAYALKESPAHITTIIRKANFYNISENGFYLNWNELQSNDEAEYLYYISVTPYYYENDDFNGTLCKGQSSLVYYTVNGDLSHYSNVKNEVTGSTNNTSRGTVYLNDFYLSGVSVKMSPILSDYIISWTGTTTLPLVPDSDTIVIVTYCAYGGDGTTNIVVEEYVSTTIGAGNARVNSSAIIDLCTEKGLVWDGEMRLTPCYKMDNVLYIGEQTVINLYDETIKNVGDSGNGTIVEEDVTDLDNSDYSDVTVYGKYAFNMLKSLVNSLGELPSLLKTVFGFIPSIYLDALGLLLIVVLILRILGR